MFCLTDSEILRCRKQLWIYLSFLGALNHDVEVEIDRTKTIYWKKRNRSIQRLKVTSEIGIWLVGVSGHFHFWGQAHLWLFLFQKMNSAKAKSSQINLCCLGQFFFNNLLISSIRQWYQEHAFEQVMLYTVIISQRPALKYQSLNWSWLLEYQWKNHDL